MEERFSLSFSFKVLQIPVSVEVMRPKLPVCLGKDYPFMLLHIYYDILFYYELLSVLYIFEFLDCGTFSVSNFSKMDTNLREPKL